MGLGDVARELAVRDRAQLHKNQRRDTAYRLRLLEAHGREVDAAAESARESATEAWATLADVRRLVLGLPEEQRAVLLLVAVEGLSYREAADLLDLPFGTMTSRLARAREALRAAAGAGAGRGLLEEA